MVGDHRRSEVGAPIAYTRRIAEGAKGKAAMADLEMGMG